mmetsp:Transcript_108922/g.232746  ORF Transcript_108922/g.232746 Transcript_108922/m.232746 type:complete len:889 (-) Transcript_108922:69-2735(-)
MGCCSSGVQTAGDSSEQIQALPPAKFDAAEAVSGDHGLHKVAHERLVKLQELDEATKIPFILIELTGEADGKGEIEVCGKDEYGVYRALDEWLTSTWFCSKLDSGDLSEETPVPFCDCLYRWEGYRTAGDDGMSNMGLATMRLVDFMTNQLSWTLGVINGGNVGKEGEIREQQIIFKAPHPMNLVAPHCMIELRSAGCIEVCGDACGIFDELDNFFEEHFKATSEDGHEDFCDRFYRCAKGVFKERGRQGENNLGLLTTKVCDFVGRLPGWNLVTMNGGNYGDKGCHREQQLVFRWDNHPLQAQPHLLVELRGTGYVEVNGEDDNGIYEIFENWLTSSWRCSRSTASDEFSNRKYKWAPKDMMSSSAEVVSFFHSKGWQMQVCSQGTVKVAGQSDVREQQMLFRPGMSSVDFVEPHLFIELYTGEGKEELYAQPTTTQVLANQHIRFIPVGECRDALKKFGKFADDFLGGEKSSDRQYSVDCFLSRGFTDNNLGCWTMRICDFMVDRLGWSFVVCNVCNLGERGQFREQQLVFRYDGERREIPVTDDTLMKLEPSIFSGVQFPPYWSIDEVRDLQKVQAMAPCEQEETEALQEIMDRTFRRILTRDRVYEYQASTSEEMPFRLELVHAFRSENMPLCKRFLDRRKAYGGGSHVSAKTSETGKYVNDRLQEGEALLFHGTNPSSAISILKTGFVLANAGKSTGTMFGYGVYMAECCSKSDEYATDDGGGTFPGLRALLVCRCLVGNPYIVHDAGDYIAQAKADGCDCVLGDRETKVNTYREYVFFDESQVVPEYTVLYKRQYEENKVPKALRRKSTGTTGRNWQVKLEKGWANIPPEVNRQLLIALKDGQTKVEVEIGSFMYVFDLAAKTQLNKSTGTSRQLRPPMIMS